MKSLLKLNKAEQSPCCAICVYCEKQKDYTMFCTKKKKEVRADKKCFSFKVDIMSLGVKRKHGIDVNINPDDFSI